MAPKANQAAPKNQGRGKSKPDPATQISKIEYGLPQTVVTSLQAIQSRTTQDLWSAPAALPGDMTLEQQFQRQATAFHKLSRRVTGDLKAKQDLGLSLSACMGTISQHLVGLIQRVRALGAKLDDDLQEACRDMEESLSWFQLWLRVLRPIVEAGQAHIGELVSDAGQDVAWPLSSDTSLIPKLHADSETLWAVLVSIAVSGVEGNMSDLFTLMGEMLQRIRLCPAALPGIRQGLVVAIQASMGNLRDPMQYAPATAQEWLYPSLLLEQSCVFQGLVSESFSEEIKKLMALPCPYVPPPLSGPEVEACT